MTLNKNNWRAWFLQIKDFNTGANMCKNNFQLATNKNDNRAVAMREKNVRHKQNQQLYQYKQEIIG